MYRLITYHPQNYIDEYQDELFMMTGKKYSLSSIYRQIRRCGYSCQKIYIRAAEIDQMERIDFKLRLHNLCIRPEMLVAIDETAKMKISGCRERMWARRGNSFTPYLNRFFGTRKQRYSMIAAADIDGFILEACSIIVRERGDDDPDLTRGTVGRERFKIWLREKLLPTLGDYSLGEKRSLVLIDNATIHHDDEIVAMIKSTGAEVLYLPPYSPDFNPIENFFYIYKQSLKRFHKLPWFCAHYGALLSVTPRHGRSFFARCNIPACHEFEELLVEDDEGIAAAIVAIMAFIVTNTAINNFVAVFVLILKLKMDI